MCTGAGFASTDLLMETVQTSGQSHPSLSGTWPLSSIIAGPLSLKPTPLMLPLPLWLHLSGPFPQCCPLPMFLPSLTCKASISHESELRAISSLIHTGPPPPLPVSHSRRLLRCLLIQHFPHLLLPTCIRGTLRRRRLPSGHCILNTWDTF